MPVLICPCCNMPHITAGMGLTACLNLRESLKDEPIWLSRAAMTDMERLKEITNRPVK